MDISIQAAKAMQDRLYEKMYEVEDRHWWFSAKRTIINSLLDRFLMRKVERRPLRLVDLGCGCGRTLQELPPGVEGIGLDSSPLAVDFCAKRGVNARLGRVPDRMDLDEAAYDAVLLADVIEHVEDDDAVVAAAARLVAPGGIMIVTVPALPPLWSRWDEIHGHKRRYTKGRLAAVLDNDALKVEFISYFNTLLLPPAVAARVITKGSGRVASAQLDVPARPLNAILRATFAAERHLLGRVALPVGLSLVALMRKRSAP